MYSNVTSIHKSALIKYWYFESNVSLIIYIAKKYIFEA